MHKYAVGQKVRFVKFAAPITKENAEFLPMLGQEGVILEQTPTHIRATPCYRTTIWKPASPKASPYIAEQCLAPIDDTCTRFLTSLTAAPKKEPFNV